MGLGVGPGHEVVDLAGGMAIDEAGQDVGDVGLRIDGVEFAGLDQRSDHAPVHPALVGAGEEGILAISGKREGPWNELTGINADDPDRRT
jgi:hypothetical protein